MAQGGRGCAERYFREGMLALPYGFRKLGGARREGLCEYAANGLHDLGAQSGYVCAERYFREGMLALPYRLREFYR